MTLDIAAIRSKLDSLKNNKRPSESLFKPEKGKQLVRIVPLASNPNNPFVELYFHYLGGKTVLSPRSFGERDPIAEFADKLRQQGDKESWQLSRQFQPKMRTYVPVIQRGKEELGVKFWAFGKLVYQELLAVMADPDYGDITDPKSGRDVVVEFTPQEESDTNFAKTSIRVKPNQTPLTTDSALLEKLLNEQPDIATLYTAPTYAELEGILENYLNPEVKSKDSAPVEDAEPASVSASKKTPAAKGSTSAVEDFDELFNS